MNTEQRRQSKRIQGIEASLVSEIGERNRKPNEVGARLKVPTKDYADVETQEFQAIDHSDPNHGAESLNRSEAQIEKQIPRASTGSCCVSRNRGIVALQNSRLSI